MRGNPSSMIDTTARSTRVGLAALAVAAALALAVACGGEAPAPPAEQRPEGPARAVATAPVERSEDTDRISVPGVVQARQRAALSARIPASVVELPFREGERVEAGALLVRLDDAAFKAALSAAETAAKAADADLARAQALLAKGAATQREVDGAAAQAAAAGAAVSGARDSLSYAVLRAPFAGTVATRPVNLGDVVGPGRTLVEIEGTGGYELRASVEAEDVRRLRSGLKLEARVDGLVDPVPATVRVIAPGGDPATHRFEVKADLAPTAGLRSGLFVRLLLPSEAGPARLLVPESAVFRRGGLMGVFVVEEGRARLRWVATGETSGGMTEIRSGVAGGERVVLEPAGLTDGAAVVEK